jgi:hypothetical protein
VGVLAKSSHAVQSAKGDLKALQILLPMLRDIEDRADDGSADAEVLAEADRQIMQRIKTRLGGESE